MPESPFEDLRRELSNPEGTEQELDGVRSDLTRQRRTGVPEIIYCQAKTSRQIVAATQRLASAGQKVIGTRCPEQVYALIEGDLKHAELTCQYEAQGSLFIAFGKAFEPPVSGGVVGILTAGTTDWPVAFEAQVIAESMGCTVFAHRDVGVAGLHRLVDPLESLCRQQVDVIVVAAGMDGVLPSVVSGLVDVPVIGLPTSTGYGHGGQGEGALTTMLQTCAPGIAVVNIDNGVGAGATAGLIARRASRRMLS